MKSTVITLLATAVAITAGIGCVNAGPNDERHDYENEPAPYEFACAGAIWWAYDRETYAIDGYISEAGGYEIVPQIPDGGRLVNNSGGWVGGSYDKGDAYHRFSHDITEPEEYGDKIIFRQKDVFGDPTGGKLYCLAAPLPSATDIDATIEAEQAAKKAVQSTRQALLSTIRAQQTIGTPSTP